MEALPLGMFLIFLRRIAEVLTPPRLSVVFSWLVGVGSSRLAYTDQWDDRPMSSQFRPISITSILSNV